MKKFNFRKAKTSGDASITLIGMFLTLLVTFVFILTLQIQQINLLYEETDETLALSVLSAAVINREDAYSSQQVVIHELDKFNGDITSEYALRVLGETNDDYLQDSYEYFLQTFTDNFRLDTNLIPANTLINSSISIVEYTIHNVWHELDEDGIRTGNFRICKYSYDPASNIWNTTWYPMNQIVMVPDSLTQTNVQVEYSMVSAQVKMTVTKLPYIAGIFEDDSKLTQEVYYVRNADIKEHEDLIKDREESAENGTGNLPNSGIIPDTPDADNPDSGDDTIGSSVAITIKETLNGNTKSNVSIENIGDTSAYIRAAVIITWQDADGNIYGQVPVAGTAYEISYETEVDANGIGWVLGSDGFYYWTSPIAPGESTGILIEKCADISTDVPDGYYLSVEIIGSSIQSSPTDAVINSWSSGVEAVVSKNIDGNAINVLTIN